MNQPKLKPHPFLHHWEEGISSHFCVLTTNRHSAEILFSSNDNERVEQKVRSPKKVKRRRDSEDADEATSFHQDPKKQEMEHEGKPIEKRLSFGKKSNEKYEGEKFLEEPSNTSKQRRQSDPKSGKQTDGNPSLPHSKGNSANTTPSTTTATSPVATRSNAHRSTAANTPHSNVPQTKVTASSPLVPPVPAKPPIPSRPTTAPTTPIAIPLKSTNASGVHKGSKSPKEFVYSVKDTEGKGEGDDHKHHSLSDNEESEANEYDNHSDNEERTIKLKQEENKHQQREGLEDQIQVPQQDFRDEHCEEDGEGKRHIRLGLQPKKRTREEMNESYKRGLEKLLKFDELHKEGHIVRKNLANFWKEPHKIEQKFTSPGCWMKSQGEMGW